MSRLALSSWAVHDWIGQTFHQAPGEPAPSGQIDRLLDLPSRARDLGISALEICHFHLPPDEGELGRLQGRAEECGVELFQLLIDAGDIAHPTEGQTQLAFVESWLRLAALGGFRGVRVIAGKQSPTSAAIERAVAGLRRLKAVGDELGTGVSTENWQDLASTPEVVSELIERSGVGLVFDFGNWGGDDKYARLGEIVRFATSCHAKCDFAAGRPLLEDFETCLGLVLDSGFDETLTLVHPEAPDEWAALAPQQAAVERIFGSSVST